jgi:hypothetical protein
MEAARTSEMLVNFYQTTRRYNPEDSHQLSIDFPYYAGSEVLTAASMKMTIFWDLAPCCLVEVYRCFIGIAASTIKVTSKLLPDNTALHPRRQTSSIFLIFDPNYYWGLEFVDSYFITLYTWWVSTEACRKLYCLYIQATFSWIYTMLKNLKNKPLSH